MWTTPEKHTKSRTKPQAELYARCLKKLQRKHSELKEPREMLDKTKTLTIIARQNKAKRKSPKMNEPVKLKRSPMKTILRRTEPYKMLKRTTKPLRRRVLIEEGPAKSSKKQHSDNADKWQLCKAGSFHTVNHRGPLPLRELHSTGETIVWRDPGGS